MGLDTIARMKVSISLQMDLKKKYIAKDPKPRYKARLVAKGFKQKQDVEFDEIFSPMVKMTTLH